MKKFNPMAPGRQHPPCTILYLFCMLFLILLLVLQGGLIVLNPSTHLVHDGCPEADPNHQTHKKHGDGDGTSSTTGIGTSSLLSYPPYLEKLVQDKYKVITAAMRGGGTCDGRRIFLYDVPPEFSTDLAAQCTEVGRGRCGAEWGCLYCGGLENEGLGQQVAVWSWNSSGMSGVFEDVAERRTAVRDVNGFSANYSVLLRPATAWFRTHQFALEPIVHARMRRYPCLTADASAADALYVPYYAGQDVALSVKCSRTEARDSRVDAFVRWLTATEAWRQTGGRRHAMALGRQPFDLDRPPAARRWGLPLTTQPALANLTFLRWELGFSSGVREIGVPYPTAFHPSSDAHLGLWQDMLKKAKREWIVSYLGSAKRRFRDPNILELRKELKKQCEANLQHCRFMDCTLQYTRNQLPCESHPEAVILEFTNAIFCLQPPGDTPTRKSVFDSLLSGCIPVLFSNLTAHAQYSPFGFLPQDPNLYSITLPHHFLGNTSSSNFVQELLDVPRARIHQIQQTIIYDILPHIVYTNPLGSTTFHDAIDTGLHYLFDKLINEDM